MRLAESSIPNVHPSCPLRVPLEKIRVRKIEIPKAPQADLGCPDCRLKTFRFSPAANQSLLPLSRAHKRGVSRSSRTLGAGCDERGDVTRRMTLPVRRSRVVLTPRRWRQVGDDAWSFS